MPKRRSKRERKPILIVRTKKIIHNYYIKGDFQTIEKGDILDIKNLGRVLVVRATKNCIQTRMKTPYKTWRR